MKKRSFLCFLGLYLFFLVSGVSGEQIKNITLPEGCRRAEYPAGSFSRWLQNLPLKDDHAIFTFSGSAVPISLYSIYKVVDLPLMFEEDLEQCADWCMRLWGDFHKSCDMLGSLYLFSYTGDKVFYRDSGLSYRQFLRRAFVYSNSFSLKQGCGIIDSSSPVLKPGDMFVQNDTGGIGHISMVLDVCTTRRGEALYLIGFSFMPAQEFHIEKAPAVFGAGSYGREGWFSLDGYLRYLREKYPFGEPVLRRFS